MARRTGYLLLLVATALACCTHQAAVFWGGKPSTCRDVVAAYTRSHGRHNNGSGSSREFIFFLHVPRTAGKTYAQCFLRAAIPPSKRCAPSYDQLRLNVSIEDCTYLNSHDDYSLTQQLPANAAVITQLRKPVQRVVSAYEFAVEVAARKVTMDDELFEKERQNTTFINTLRVWPWSHLVPWFRQDIRARMAALKAEATANGSLRPPIWEEHWDTKHNRTYYWQPATKQSVWEKPPANVTLDPYDNPLVMPLAEWIETDIARELVHDGATLQVLGLTNLSFWAGHADLRRCFAQDAHSREALWDVAAERLEAMAHVGLTEQLEESVLSMAADLGYSMNSTAYKTTYRTAFSYDGPDFDPSANITYNSTERVEAGENVTLNVEEARRKLARMKNEVRSVEVALLPLERQLQELVDKEEAWLAEEEERAADHTAAGGLRRAWAWLHGLIFPTAAPGKTAVTSSMPRAAEMPAAANATGANSTSASATGANATSDSGTSAVASSANATTAGLAPGGKQGATEGGGGGGGGGQQQIDSPWAAEIVALDDRVYGMQQRVALLRRDSAALAVIEVVAGVPPTAPRGRSRLILPDEEHREPTPLGPTYLKCSANASSRASTKRKSAFKHLRTPWEETFAFGSEARRQISAATLARIEELNSADALLWELGRDMLAARLAEHREAGVLDVMPAVPGKGGGGGEREPQLPEQPPAEPTGTGKDGALEDESAASAGSDGGYGEEESENESPSPLVGAPSLGVESPLREEL